MKMLLKNQKFWIINGGNTTKHFKLEKETRQVNPISAYLFILVLEIVLCLLRNIKTWKPSHI